MRLASVRTPGVTLLAIFADRCDGVQCGDNAFCDNGYCRCDVGYAGDPNVKCSYQGMYRVLLCAPLPAPITHFLLPGAKYSLLNPPSSLCWLLSFKVVFFMRLMILPFLSYQ